MSLFKLSASAYARHFIDGYTINLERLPSFAADEIERSFLAQIDTWTLFNLIVPNMDAMDVRGQVMVSKAVRLNACIQRMLRRVRCDECGHASLRRLTIPACGDYHHHGHMCCVKIVCRTCTLYCDHCWRACYVSIDYDSIDGYYNGFNCWNCANVTTVQPFHNGHTPMEICRRYHFDDCEVYKEKNVFLDSREKV